MTGGYESEDRQAELEEMRAQQERQARQKLLALRRLQREDARRLGKPVADEEE